MCYCWNGMLSKMGRIKVFVCCQGYHGSVQAMVSTLLAFLCDSGDTKLRKQEGFLSKLISHTPHNWNKMQSSLKKMNGSWCRDKVYQVISHIPAPLHQPFLNKHFAFEWICEQEEMEMAVAHACFGFLEMMMMMMMTMSMVTKVLLLQLLLLMNSESFNYINFLVWTKRTTS